MAVLIRSGRNVKFDRVCRIIRHWSGMWFIWRSSQVPSLMHTCIHWIYNFSHNTARFLRSCHAQNTKLRKKAGEKEQSCSSCFKSAKCTCLRCQGYFCILCSVFENDERSNCQAAGKQAVQSHIVSHVSEKLWRSKKRSNVMIQMNLAKIDIYRSKRNGVLQSGNQWQIWYRTQAIFHTWNKG